MDQAKAEQYLMLKNALLAMRDDLSAVISLLAFQTDNGASWLEAADAELRMMLVRGLLDDAESLGSLVGTVLRIRDGDEADAEHAKNRVHQRSMRSLTDGIGAILDQDVRTGLALLSDVADAESVWGSLRWAAWFWISKANSAKGDLKEAVEAASKALTMSSSMDQQARSVCLTQLAQLDHLRGYPEKALAHLEEAGKLFLEIGDERGQATTHLARARMEAWAGDQGAADASARRAMAADTAWEEPVLFLARRAMVAGEVKTVRELLEPLAEREHPSRQAVQELRLVQLLDDDEVPLNTMKAFCALRAFPPSQDRIDTLKKLLEQQPDFVQLRAFLGWCLIKVGSDDEAAPHFEKLSVQKLDQDLHASVLLGLGCLANRRHRNKKTGARLRRASEMGLPVSADLDAVLPGNLISEDDIDAIDAALEGVRVPESSEHWGETIEAEFIVGNDGSPSLRDAVTGADVEDLVPEDPSATAEQVFFDFSDPPDPMPMLGREERGQPEEVVRSGASARAAFTGDLQLLSVPDLLEFLKSSRRTGTLVITSEAGIGAIHLKRGMIAGAASPAAAGLGDLLRDSGDITQEELDAAIAAQDNAEDGRLLGSFIVAKGLVEGVVVRAALARQVTAAIIEMLDWSTGCFAFEPDRAADPDAHDIDIELDTQGILLDALREYDEMNK